MRVALATATCLLLPVAGFSPGELFEWEPIPFQHEASPGEAPTTGPAVSPLTNEVLEAEYRTLQQAQVALDQEANEIERWNQDLQRRKHHLFCEKERFRQNWAQQETSLLHLIVFRLVRIEASSLGTLQLGAGGPSQLVPGAFEGSSSPDSSSWDLSRGLGAGKPLEGEVVLKSPIHPKWLAVEAVACTRPHIRVVAGEYPIHQITRASTSLPITDICLDGLGTPTNPASHELLPRLLQFAQEQHATTAHEDPPRLFIVTAGSSNLFFNTIAEASNATTHQESYDASASEFARRFEAILDRGLEGLPREALSLLPAIVATEPLCREGSSVRPCQAEEANSGGPFWYHAGALAGSAKTLEVLFSGMQMIQQEELEKAKGFGGGAEPHLDLSTLLRKLLGRYPHLAVPDDRHELFGSFVQRADGPCQAMTPSQKSDPTALPTWCGQTPCCPRNVEFATLHAYFDEYTTVGCSLRRLEAGGKGGAKAAASKMPLLWHGDGLAKWHFALGIDQLASTCSYVARLVLHSHPVDLLSNLFARFEDTQAPGAVATHA